jgi:hypothetical protein
MTKTLLVFTTLLVLLVPRLGLAQTSPTDANTCSEITAVRHIPFHPDERVNDLAYNQLREKSWAVVSCLIAQITDSAVTPDPRSAPIYPKVRVGDVAFWVVRDITALPYDDMFPAALRKRFKKEGVYAYLTG